jgi:hypothetical protein
MKLLVLLVCLATLQGAPVLSYVHTAVDKPVIDVNDYFQIPADMVDHFPLLHNSEKLQQIAAFAHIIKDQQTNSWTTQQATRSIQIPSVLTELSFLYQNPQTGTITKIHNNYSTVADIVYLEQLHSVLHVECDLNSTLTITYNASLSKSSSGLRFGLKRVHFTEFTKIYGGQSFFCNSSCAMGSKISRNVLAVISHAEDNETGLLTSITLLTSQASEENMYNTDADFFVNGSFALIPKTNLRLNHNSSRLSWQGYLRKVHVARESFRRRSAAKLRNYDFGTTFGLIKTGFAAEVRYVNSNTFFINIFNVAQRSLTIQASICSISTTIPHKEKPRRTFLVGTVFLDARTATHMPVSRSSSGEKTLLLLCFAESTVSFDFPML